MDRRTRECVEDAIDHLVRKGTDPGELREWLLDTLRRATERSAPWDDEDTKDQRPHPDLLRASRTRIRR